MMGENTTRRSCTLATRDGAWASLCTVDKATFCALVNLCACAKIMCSAKMQGKSTLLLKCYLILQSGPCEVLLLLYAVSPQKRWTGALAMSRLFLQTFNGPSTFRGTNASFAYMGGKRHTSCLFELKWILHEYCTNIARFCAFNWT